jgi:hypothetical protein
MKLWKCFFSKKSFFEFVFTYVVVYIINYIFFGQPSYLERLIDLVIPSVLAWILYEYIYYKMINKITKKIYSIYMAILIPIISFLIFWAYLFVIYLTFYSG